MVSSFGGSTILDDMRPSVQDMQLYFLQPRPVFHDQPPPDTICILHLSRYLIRYDIGFIHAVPDVWCDVQDPGENVSVIELFFEVLIIRLYRLKLYAPRQLQF